MILKNEEFKMHVRTAPLPNVGCIPSHISDTSFFHLWSNFLFLENLRSASNTLLRGVNEFLSVLSVFIVRSVRNSVQKICV